jgi:hypothetical protein
MMATMTSKDERIKKERDKLTKQFSAIDERRKKIVEKTIDNCAYMSVILEDLKAQMDAKGDEAYVSTYQNGENQWGTKKSPEIEIYNQVFSNYLKGVKQLTDLLPEEMRINSEDKEINAINEFLKT